MGTRPVHRLTWPATVRHRAGIVTGRAGGFRETVRARTRMWAAGVPTRRMATIALIGPDGAGKTSVAQGLLATCPLPLKYLYMGTSIESSNLALPTSRLAHRIKVAEQRRALRKAGRPVPEVIELHGVEHRVDRRGKLGAAARLFKRISEETYRELRSWMYQRQGYTMLYDRHFLFDAVSDPERPPSSRRLTDRIHDWFLLNVYPRPDLVILLDAPNFVLLARKQEVPAAMLDDYRRALIAKTTYAESVAHIDASAPYDTVLSSVREVIARHLAVTGSG